MSGPVFAPSLTAWLPATAVPPSGLPPSAIGGTLSEGRGGSDCVPSLTAWLPATTAVVSPVRGRGREGGALTGGAHLPLFGGGGRRREGGALTGGTDLPLYGGGWGA